MFIRQDDIITLNTDADAEEWLCTNGGEKTFAAIAMSEWHLKGIKAQEIETASAITINGKNAKKEIHKRIAQMRRCS